MLMCSLIKDTFELTRYHARRRGLLPDLKSQSWFEFARLIRNCLGHKFLFEFNNHDRTVLPVHWHGRVISVDMDGKPLPMALFGYVEAWQLFTEMRQYAIDRGL